jgi:hypothetical protein
MQDGQISSKTMVLALADMARLSPSLITKNSSKQPCLVWKTVGESIESLDEGEGHAYIRR